MTILTQQNPTDVCPPNGKENPNDSTTPSDTITAEALYNLARTMGFDEECIKTLDSVVSSDEYVKSRNGIPKKSIQKFKSNVETKMRESGCGAKALEFNKNVDNIFNSQCSYNKIATFYKLNTTNTVNAIVDIKSIDDTLLKLIDRVLEQKSKLEEDRSRFYLYLYDKVDDDVKKMEYISANIKWPGEGSLQSSIYLLEKLSVVSIDQINISITQTNLLSSTADTNEETKADFLRNAIKERDDNIRRNITEETGLTTFSPNIEQIVNNASTSTVTDFTNTINDILKNSSISAETTSNAILILTRPIVVRQINLNVESQSGIIASQISTIAATSSLATMAKIRENSDYNEIVVKRAETVADTIYQNKKAAIDASVAKEVAKGTNSNGTIIIIVIVIIIVIALGVGGYIYAKSKGYI